MAVCEWNKFNTKYKIYLFAVPKETPFMKKMYQIRQYMKQIFSKVKKPINDVIIEKQIPNTPNEKIEYAYVMLLSEFAEEYKFTFSEQHGEQKYRVLDQIFGAHDKGNNKVLGAQVIAQAYIDQNLVEVHNIGHFGINGSRRRRDGSVVKARWYSDNTYRFCVDNDIDKLDDVADTILMILAYKNNITNRTYTETYSSYAQNDNNTIQLGSIQQGNI